MTEKLIEAVNEAAEAMEQIAEGYAALALAARAWGQNCATPSPAPTSATQAPSLDDLPFADEWLPPDPGEHAPERHGSAAVCPAHNLVYLSGKFGDYCPARSDDPKWSNQKGYCTVTPKSAAAWLRQKAAVGA